VAKEAHESSRLARWHVGSFRHVLLTIEPVSNFGINWDRVTPAIVVSNVFRQ
jgi:hypothetical protein